MFVWSDVLTKIRLLTYGHILLKSGNLKDSFHTILHFCSEFEVFAIMKNIFSLFALVWSVWSKRITRRGLRMDTYSCKMAIFFILFSLLLYFLYKYFFLFIYRTSAIIIRGLYTFYPIFEGQKRFLRSFFCKILTLCTVSIQAQVINSSAHTV